MNKIFKILSLAACVLSCVLSFAQSDMTVRGKITDKNGEPVIGATVMLSGQESSVGAISDIDGNYVINVPSKSWDTAVLTVSCLSYATQEKKIEGQHVVNFVLRDDAQHLDEVVVIGYGAMRRSDLTGSVTSVKIEENDADRVSSFDELLKGKAAGVSIVSTNASPDASVSIRVRGTTSLNGSNEPLYVIDGVIMSDPQNVSMGVDADEEVNALFGINPRDIASIEILKDASATAIYGAAGANGVVLITTKSANRDRPTITFRAGIDISNQYKQIEMLDFDQWREYVKALGNECNVLYEMYPEDYKDPALAGKFKLDENGEKILTVKPVNWQDFLLRTSVSQRYYLSINGRTKPLNYSFSIGYNKKEGIVIFTGAEQYTMRLNVTRKIFRNFSVGTRTNVAYISSFMTQGLSTTNLEGSSSMMRSMMISRPYMSKTLEEEIDDLDGDPTARATPARWISDFKSLRTEFRVTPYVFAEWAITDWLQFKTSFGADYRLSERTKWKGSTINNGTNGSIASVSGSDTYKWTFDNTFNASKKIDNHRINATLGMSTSRSKSAADVVSAWNIAEHKAKYHSINSGLNSRLRYSESATSKHSYFARAMYNYDDRYLVTATYRLDGSSNFSKANRYASFPSFALAWRLSEEPWLNADWLSMAKLRVGWGQVGNSGVSPYQIYPTFGAVQYPDHTPGNDAEYIVGVVPTNIANPGLKWETTRQWNGGLDLGFFDGRLALTVDLYDKFTFDLLQQKMISGTSGFTTTWVNDGSIRNQGLEISVDATPVAYGDFEWNVSGQISFNRNSIASLGMSDGGGEIFLAPGHKRQCNYFEGATVGSSNYMQSTANIFIEGFPVGLFYGYKTNGIVQTGERGYTLEEGVYSGPGSIKYCDLNGNGYIESGDRTIIGNPNPDFTYGFSTMFRWRGLTFSAAFEGSYGNDLINANLPQESDVRKRTKGISQTNIRKEYFYNAWTPEKPNNKYPALDSYSVDEIRLFTDRYVEDASYLRISNVSLNYEVPLPLNKFLKGLSVGISGNNLYVFTKYSGWDPDVNSYGKNLQKVGIDIGSYPTARTYSFDLRLTF